MNKKRVIFALQVAATIAAFAFIATKVDLNDIVRAWKALTPVAIATALGWTLLALCVGSVRWRLLLKAYGARRLPSLLRLLHLYAVGNFYNLYVPGGVGGDLVRGVVSRNAFDGGTALATTGGVTVVFVERVCGVAALLTISALSFVLRPIPGLDNVLPFALLGIGVAIAAVIGLALAPKIAPHAPRPIARLLGALPPLVYKPAFFGAVCLSIVIQSAVAFTGHAVMSAVSPGVALSDSVALVPLAAASAFFPLTVGGAGVREGAFAALYSAVGVPGAVAVAGSLAFWAAQLAVGAIGGVLAVIAPLSAERTA